MISAAPRTFAAIRDAKPTPPSPITATELPWLDRRGVQRGACPGGDAAADQRRYLQRDFGFDGDDRARQAVRGRCETGHAHRRK